MAGVHFSYTNIIHKQIKIYELQTAMKALKNNSSLLDRISNVMLK